MSEGGEIGYLNSIKQPETKNQQDGSLIEINKKGGAWVGAGKATHKGIGDEWTFIQQDHKEENPEVLFSLMKITGIGAVRKDPYYQKHWGEKQQTTPNYLRGKEFIETKTITLKDEFSHNLNIRGNNEFATVHLKDDLLSVANKGNFRAFLAKDGSAEELTRDVAPTEEVAVSEHVLAPGQYPLVMASAGLWKSGLTPEEAAKIIYHLYQENPAEKDPEKASKLLRDEAMKRLTERGEEIPDISVMVVNLDIPEKGVTSLADRRQQKAARPYGRGMAA